MSTNRVTVNQGFLAPGRYPFPVVDPERVRWDYLHDMLTLSMPEESKPYHYSVKAAEAVNLAMEGVGRAVLDVGCGTGKWANAMARRFPASSVIGIDLIPLPQTDPPPANVEFRQGDVNPTLPFENASFNVVHARSVDHGVNYPGFLSEVARVLRPGGVFLVCMGYMSLFDEAGKPIKSPPGVAPGFNGLQNLLLAMGRLAYYDRGAPITRKLWVDWMTNSNFSARCRNLDKRMPIGPPDKDGAEPTVGGIAWNDISGLIKTMERTLLRAAVENVNPDYVAAWVKDARERTDNATGSFFSHWASAYGVRSSLAYVPIQG